jgi:16S rRNA (cytosine1402-N4)-methyltransferase
MVAEVLRHLGLAEIANAAVAPVPSAGKRIIMDCTVGRGGHALRIAQAMSRQGGGMLVALDVDPANLKFARNRLEEAACEGVEVRTFHANFAEAADVLETLGIERLDGLLADFGVSTNQLLETKHGLSFNADLPLDMRLDPRIRKKAADLLAEWDEKTIAQTLQEYAQERYAWRIARKIVQTRATQPILSTGQLASLVRSVMPPAHGRPGQIDPATRTFQALRMAVNLELENIDELLATVPAMMGKDGRAVFISFHSGEDRLVKQASRQWADQGLCELLTKKTEEPGEAEQYQNPRSRSAKLRAVKWIGS